jgi:hypothetical protein
MDLSWAAIIAFISGTIMTYVTRVYQFVFWQANISLDSMKILVQENTNNKGRNIKFHEDKVDPLNPTHDSGMLMNRHWTCTYSSSGTSDKSSSSGGMFSFSSGGDGELVYVISAARMYRKKLMKIVDDAMSMKAVGHDNKIFIVTQGSIYYVGEINEEHLDVPDVIKSRLNGDRTTRLNIFLHGPAGTGKTTISRAIAQMLKMPIYILAITSWWDVTDFIRALQRIPDDSVILFDDLDVTLDQLLRADVERGSSAIPLRFSTASIMAFLDGIFMKHKRWIVVMCTNDPEKVKRLLRLRPGRVHIDYECTQVFVDDYVVAAQEAKKIVDQMKAEKAKADAETKAKAPVPLSSGGYATVSCKDEEESSPR